MAWCNVAKSLIDAAPQGGTPINESAWREVAKDEIDQAKALNPAQADSISKLALAQGSFDGGHYGAAIYDAVFVINNEERLPTDDETAKLEAQSIVDQGASSLWGRIYRSHAAFLLLTNQSRTALSTARFASELDDASKKMEAVPYLGPNGMGAAKGELADNGQTGQSAKPGAVPWAGIAWVGTLASLCVFLFIVALMLYLRTKRRADGSEGYPRVARAKQKKG
jgi:hypothetical protein